jgi:hypothetical protein
MKTTGVLKEFGRRVVGRCGLPARRGVSVVWALNLSMIEPEVNSEKADDLFERSEG